MTNLIITNNSYLKLALKNLCLNMKVQSDLLLIDLDSFDSLSGMMCSLRRLNINDNVSVCLLGTNSINFNVLSSYKPIRVDEGLIDFKNKIVNYDFSTFIELKTFMINMNQMKMLTPRQKQCLHVLKVYGEISDVSKVTGLSIKTVYAIIRNAAKQIHLTSLHQVRQFLSNNHDILNER